MPSDKHIAKFQELYLNRFKKKIGKEEAREKLAALVRFVKIVLKPMNEEEFRELERRHNITQ